MTRNYHLIISGILFTVVLILWPVFMALAQPEGDMIHHFIWINSNLPLFKIQFLLAALIAPCMLYLMLAQLEAFTSEKRIFNRLGLIFLGSYLVLVSIAYTSQIIVMPNLIAADMLKQARLWYMGSDSSIIYFVNQLGYCFWGIGALLLFIPLIRKHGLIRYISLIYAISAVLSLLAFTGLMMGNKGLNALTLYSGLLLVPIGILTLFTAVKRRESKGDETTTEAKP